jgi:hypothetical protein
MLRYPRPAAAFLAAALLLPLFAPAQQSPQPPAKQSGLTWDPPKLDAKLKLPPGTPPCEIDKVLVLAGARASELVDNLQNFTAREQIDYRIFGAGGFGDTRRSSTDSFDYTATIVKHGETFSVQESRNPSQAAMGFPMESQDVGLPEMALIFLPDLHPDYDMKCEAAML